MSFIGDIGSAFGRVLTRNKPTGEGLVSFVGDEIIGTALGWTAGLISSAIVEAYFVKKGIGNLWGLAAQRTALSGEAYGWTEWGISYAVGLATVIIVRTAILGTLREYRAIQRERRR